MKKKNIIILGSLILLTIIIYFITNTNAEIIVRQATAAEILDEKTLVKTAALISKRRSSNDQVEKDTLGEELEKYYIYAGGGKAEVTEEAEDDSILVVTFTETGNQYTININTGLTRVPTIGDYVNYTPASFGNYTVQSSQSGYRNGNQTYTGSKITGIKWRILNINENTGVVQIISEPFGLSGLNTDGNDFEGSEGFSNGRTVLNAICSNVLKLNTNVADSIKSLTAADVNALVGYTPSGNYGGYTYGKKYGSLTHTYYTYNIANQTSDPDKLTLIDDFFNRDNGIWLPEQAVKVKNSSGSSWDRGLLVVNSKSITSYNQYQNNDSGNYSSHRVAAVVTLKPTINLTEASSTERIWNIQ